MINALIIDDEKHYAGNLQWQLKQYYPDVEILGVGNNAEKALK